VPGSAGHGVPVAVGVVPHVWLLHVAVSHAGAFGQSDAALHWTHEPSPLQTVPVPEAHAVPRETGVVPQLSRMPQLAVWQTGAVGQFAAVRQPTQCPLPLQTPPLHAVSEGADAVPQAPAEQVVTSNTPGAGQLAGVRHPTHWPAPLHTPFVAPLVQAVSAATFPKAQHPSVHVATSQGFVFAWHEAAFVQAIAPPPHVEASSCGLPAS